MGGFDWRNLGFWFDETKQFTKGNIWIGRRSSKMGVIMQQLGNWGLLNNLFMVEIGVTGMGEALVHSDNELNHNNVQNIEMVIMLMN